MRRLGRPLLGLISTMLLGLVVGIAPIMAQDEADPPAPLRPLDLGPFATSIDGLTPSRIAELDELVLEATLADLQSAMVNGEITMSGTGQELLHREEIRAAYLEGGAH